MFWRAPFEVLCSSRVAFAGKGRTVSDVGTNIWKYLKGRAVSDAGTSPWKYFMSCIFVSCASCFVLRASCFVLRASCFVLRASCFVLRASCFVLRASCFVLRASCFALRASRFVLRASCFCFLLCKKKWYCPWFEAKHGERIDLRCRFFLSKLIFRLGKN